MKKLPPAKSPTRSLFPSLSAAACFLIGVSAVPQNLSAEDISFETMREIGSGEASWYGPKFAGRPTASGERFNPEQLTAAHRTLPFGSKVRVTRVSNGQSVVVRINDRGPFQEQRLIDVSQAAARELGLIQAGRGQVKLELLQQ